MRKVLRKIKLISLKPNPNAGSTSDYAPGITHKRETYEHGVMADAVLIKEDEQDENL